MRKEVEYWPLVKEETFIVAFAVILASRFNMYGEVMYPWYLGAATMFILGRLVDKISTNWTIGILNHADQLGVDHSYSEHNPLLPARPTKKEILFTPQKLFLEAGDLTASIVFPPAAVFFAGISFFAAIHNTIIGKEVITD